MLTKFSVKNFRNFKERVEFDLATQKQYEFNTDVVKDGCVKHGMLYGKNGEGKSNLGLALVELTSHLHHEDTKYAELGNTFLNAASEDLLAEFSFDFYLNKHNVTYSYGKNESRIIQYERLEIDNQIVVEWDKNQGGRLKTSLLGTETLNSDLSDYNGSAINYIKNNAILLQDSTNHLFFDFLRFSKGMVCFKTMAKASEFHGLKPHSYYTIQEQIINGSGVDKFQDFLNSLDIKCELGIYENDIENVKRITIKHGKKFLDFLSTASSGTFSLTLLYCWFERMSENHITFAYIDEFDAFYHQDLTKIVTRMINKLDVQTILTTHNTVILSNDILRPDCYFEIYNNKILPFSQKTQRELRRAHNLEKMFRAGEFNG